MPADKNLFPLASSRTYCLWMNMPSHHQLDFIKALHEADVDLQVRFFGEVKESRRHIGWDAHPQLGQKAQYVKPSIDALDETVPDWRTKIHIVPGTVGNKFLMALVDRLIREKVNWVHWSEYSKPGLNRVIRFPFRMLYGRKINRYALGALAISKLAEKEFVSWGIDTEKIRWLPYAANPIKASDDVDELIKRFVTNRFVFMFCGSLYQGKGVDILLQSFEKVASQCPSCVLILIGLDKKDGRYQAKAKKLNIKENRVLFAGPVEFNRMKNIFPACDVFILPSRYDGWGMVLYEAASLGKALIATECCGAAHHIIVDGVNGFRVQSGDVKSLALPMQRYIASPGLAQLHGDHSKIMAEFFHPHKNVERFLCAMESFLSRS